MSPIFKSDNLGKYVRIRTGKLDANANDPDGDYPFFTCAVEPLRIASFSYDCECVLIAGNGDLNAKYYSGKFDAYQRTYIVESIDKNILDVRYLYYFLSTYMHKLREMSIGGVIKYIKLNYLTDVVVPLPPLPEQKRIAAILDKADSIRHKRQEAVRLTDDLLRSVFLDLFGDPVSNPKGWEEAALIDVAEIVSGVTKGRNLDGKQTILAPYLRVANVQDGYLNLSEIKEIEVLPSDIVKYRLLDGDILLTEGGDPDKLGRGTVWREHVEDCIHQNHIFRVRIKYYKLLPDFLSVLIGSERGKRYFLRAAKQTTGIASINSTQLKNFPVLMPSLDLQQRFAKSVSNTQKLKRRLIETEMTTSYLFSSLLQCAFKGEL
ncbi:MAG: restriction endonuclease subunit S [Desulfuromonadaceae bacterium]|nr:restriction endonuclease subunit S [Desulfuromonadaceae bacterium]MDD2848488.1 restriction endonuclease subunit S [Desulfuromonadaceae bacterium]MDD4129883.1 restriction endonuclease subunit S [Desulfuromonadaceae bacterium]